MVHLQCLQVGGFYVGESVSTLETLLQKYNITLNGQDSPISIPNVGREQLAELFCELGFTLGAEIGVDQGEYSEILCSRNPNLHLLCVDPWETYDGWIGFKREPEDAYDIARERLKNHDCTFIRKRSLDALADLADNSLDFVYVDSNHRFEYVVADIAGWSRKVRSGGIVSGHDYISRGPSIHLQVIPAVQGYTKAYSIDPWFLFGRKEMIPGEIRDTERSWAWIKP